MIQVQNIILRNFWLKFFSLALATVIWLAIHYSIEHDYTVEKPRSASVQPNNP